MERKCHVIVLLMLVTSMLAVSVNAGNPMDNCVNDQFHETQCFGGIDGGSCILLSERILNDRHEVFPQDNHVFIEKDGGDICFAAPFYPAPEFPTIAVPVGLLVGIIYILFLLKTKGKNTS